MNVEHFTEKAREALSEAAQLATQHHHSQVEKEKKRHAQENCKRHDLRT